MGHLSVFFTLLMLFAPIDYSGKNGVSQISGEHVTIRNYRRLENNNSTIPFYKFQENPLDCCSSKKPLPVKIDYVKTNEEKCANDKKNSLIKNAEIGPEEIENVKEVAAKQLKASSCSSSLLESKKTTSDVESCDKKKEKFIESKKKLSSSPSSSPSSPGDKFVKIEFVQSDRKSCGKTEPPKRGTIVCADCDKCEMQIKANGEGIVLKCHMCRQVPSEEIVFPPGNGQKVVTFP